jgi:hypothetical protein
LAVDSAVVGGELAREEVRIGSEEDFLQQHDIRLMPA